MPHTYTKEELETRYKKLPPVLKEAIFSPDVAEKMFEIGKKNGLTIEKVGFMAEETGLVILGLTRPREFVGILTDRLGVEKDAAQKIASDINREIFYPLREALKNAHEIDVSEQELHKEDLVAPKPAPEPKPEPKKEAPPVVPKEKVVPASAPQPAIIQAKIIPPQSTTLQTTAIPQASPQSIPKLSPVIPPPAPQPSEPPLPVPLPTKPVLPAKVHYTEPTTPTPSKPTMSAPPPIIIPPNPKPQIHPLQQTPQNPKIPPIDLRNTPTGIKKQELGIKDESLNDRPPAYEKHDPYREPVE